MIWYRELGFYSNPFSIKPGAFHESVIGYDLSEIVDKIDKSKVVFIEGDYGFGKTTILKHIVRRFGGRKNVVYYNCNRADGTLNIESILKGKYGFFGKVFLGLPRDMIVLLDEVEKIPQEDQKDLIGFHKEGNIKSIILFGKDFDKAGFSVEMRKQMVNNVIKLTELTEDEAVQLVRARIGALKLLPDRIIKEVFHHSVKNPRIMLENLEDLCKYAVENNEEEVTDEHVKEVLGVSVKPKRKPAKKKPAQKKEKEEPRKEVAAKKEEAKPESPQKKEEPRKDAPVKREEPRKEIPIDEEDFPKEAGAKKKPEPEFDEEQEPSEGDEDSEYFYYY
jgi:hypothetical protein